MNIPKSTGEIFEILSKGQFICSNSSVSRISKLYNFIEDEDNYDLLYDYFLNINFVLEKGDEYYYFSRHNESRADTERKLESAMRWIDLVDFLKTLDSSFGPGYSFSPSEAAVKISVDAFMQNKADGIRNILRIDENVPYKDLVAKVAELLCRDGFMESENEILNTYKVLSSFKFLEELIDNINIPEEIKDEIPE
jgi:hypothetical protein